MTGAAFESEALLTPANAVSAARLVLAVPFLWWLAADGESSALAALFWFLLTVSDGLDGFLARRQGTTSSGAFLDPLADKVLVVGALFAMVANGRMWIVPVVVITVREVAISAYRSYAARRGVSVPAVWWAKVKTVTQELAVGAALLPLTDDHVPELAGWLLWAAAALTVWTGIDYLRGARELMREGGT